MGRILKITIHDIQIFFALINQVHHHIYFVHVFTISNLEWFASKRNWYTFLSKYLGNYDSRYN